MDLLILIVLILTGVDPTAEGGNSTHDARNGRRR